MKNSEIANILFKIADQLEEEENNPYRIRAYRRAARTIKNYPKNLEKLIKEDIDLQRIPNVGNRIAKIICQILLEGLKSIPVNSKKLINVKKKSYKSQIFRINSVISVIEKILNTLAQICSIQKIECTGDYRRKKEIIEDIIIVIHTNHLSDTLEKFYLLPYIQRILLRKKNLVKVELKIGLLLTLYIADEQSIGAKILQTTGNIAHYQLLQQIAKKNKLTLTDKGLYRNKKRIAGKTEEEIYKHLKLSFIPPELRENKGEIKVASKHALPKLITLSDIKGDLHCHTNETDGNFTLEEMVMAAREYHYEYLAITDHSQSLKITHGMDEKRLLSQIKKIDKLNEKLANFVILKSMEVDILDDGSLDLSNDVLKELDLTVCSIHSKFHLNKAKQTERIIRAMENPYFNILGHPTGRLIRYRHPYELDFDRILIAAKNQNCILELNAQPARLDIHEIYCKKAKENGVKVAISSDAHTTKGFNFMILGINQARRGWLEAKDVINTYPLYELKKILKK